MSLIAESWSTYWKQEFQLSGCLADHAHFLQHCKFCSCGYLWPCTDHNRMLCLLDCLKTSSFRVLVSFLETLFNSHLLCEDRPHLWCKTGVAKDSKRVVVQLLMKLNRWEKFVVMTTKLHQHQGWSRLSWVIVLAAVTHSWWQGGPMQKQSGGIEHYPGVVIGRSMANPQGWRVRVVRVGVRVGIWLSLKNPYSWQGFQGFEYIIFTTIYIN